MPFGLRSYGTVPYAVMPGVKNSILTQGALTLRLATPMLTVKLATPTLTINLASPDLTVEVT